MEAVHIYLTGHLQTSAQQKKHEVCRPTSTRCTAFRKSGIKERVIERIPFLGSGDRNPCHICHEDVTDTIAVVIALPAPQRATLTKSAVRRRNVVFVRIFPKGMLWYCFF